MTVLTAKFKDQDVRIFANDPNKEWFHAGDVFAILNHANPYLMLPSLLHDHEYREWNVGISGRPAIYVTEPGLYKLIFKSKSEFAVEFQDWLAYEVLPSIRKTGSYGNTVEQQERASEEFNSIGFLNRLRSTQESLIDSLNESLDSEGSHEKLNAIAANLEAVRKAMQDVPRLSSTVTPVAHENQSLSLQDYKDLALKTIKKSKLKGATIRDLYRLYPIRTKEKAIEIVEALEIEGLVKVDRSKPCHKIHVT